LVSATDGIIIITDGIIIIIITATLIMDIHTIHVMTITEIIIIQTGIHQLFIPQEEARVTILSLLTGMVMYREERTILAPHRGEQSVAEIHQRDQ
jgi:hypothetical protein